MAQILKKVSDSLCFDSTSICAAVFRPVKRAVEYMPQMSALKQIQCAGTAILMLVLYGGNQQSLDILLVDRRHLGVFDEF